MRHVVKYITACCIAAKVLSQWQSRTSTWWRRVDVYAKVATKETGRTSVACGADLYRCSGARTPQDLILWQIWSSTTLHQHRRTYSQKECRRCTADRVSSVNKQGPAGGVLLAAEDRTRLYQL